jgi:hypothetical protein
MRIERILITPEMAAEWLEKNTNNRSLRTAQIRKLARDMKADKWEETGDPIKFSTHGELLDGQHRLWAIIEADVPVCCWIAFDVDSSAHSAIDTGAKRTTGDELRWRHETNPPLLASVLSVIWGYRNEALLDPRSTPSPIELLELLEAEPQIRLSLPIGTSTARAVRIPAANVAGMHYLFGREATEEEATAFFYAVRVEGAARPDTGPFVLRRYALNTYITKSKRPVRAEWVALIIKAFNYWMAGASVKHLRWRRGGKHSEAFPAILPEAFIGEDMDEEDEAA